MKKDQIKIVFSKSLFNTKYVRTAVSTILDSFTCMCGFYAGQLQSDIDGEIDPPDIHNMISVFSGNIDTSDTLDSPNIKKSIRRVFISNCGKASDHNSEEQERNRVKIIVRESFDTLKDVRPDLTDSINLFYQEKLWELAILSQTCFGSALVSEEVLDRCTDCLYKYSLNKSADPHYLYTIGYLELLSAALEEEDVGFEANTRLNSKLALLYEKSINLYTKTQESMFIKLSAMILGEMKKLDQSERMYLRYINMISVEDGMESETSKVFYDVGKLFENSSKESNYTLSTIHKSAGYYRLCVNSDPSNYRGRYKMVITPQMKELSRIDVNKLVVLHDRLSSYKEDMNATLRVYLYDYKTTNHLLAYNLKNQLDVKSNQTYLEELIYGHDAIEKIWKLLGLDEEKYPGSLNELNHYLHLRIKEIANMILDLRSKDAIGKEQLKPKYNISLPESQKYGQKPRSRRRRVLSTL